MGLSTSELLDTLGEGFCSKNTNISMDMETCAAIEKFAQTTFFASGGVIIFLLLLTLALLLVILHMKIKMNKLRKWLASCYTYT